MLSIIVATDQNYLIGKDNDMPWHIAADLKRFKAITTGHTIVMGRRTYESLPIKPLPNRHHIVLTRQKNLQLEACEMAYSVDDIIKRFSDKDSEEVFIIGGGNVYKSLLPYTHKLYLTTIHHTFEGDTYFPTLNIEEDWDIIENTYFAISDDNPYTHSFSVLMRKKQI